MKVIFFSAIIALTTVFTACKKNKDMPSEQAKLPNGQYRLIEMHRADSTGLDSAGVKFTNSSLRLTFNEAGRSASLAGKADSLNITGTYKIAGDIGLTDAKIGSTKNVATENDIAVIEILAASQSFVHKGITVVLHTKDKGDLVFSMQK